MNSSSSRIPCLDGLRALSIFLVVIGHAYQGVNGRSPSEAGWLIFANAALGVEVFFVISGYLITTLLLREISVRGGIDIWGFYIRRGFRILPALWFYILVAIILSSLGVIGPISTSAVISALSFTANYSQHANSALEHIWSLSVEEQFYLFWPAWLFFLIIKGASGQAKWVCLALIALAPVFRVLTSLYGGEFYSRHIYFMLHTRVDALMFGCLLALLEHEGFWGKLKILGGRLVIGMVVFSMVISPVLVNKMGGGYIYTVGYTIECISISCVIFYLVRNPDGLAGRALRWRPIEYLGGLSYSLYLWQEIFLKTELIHGMHFMVAIGLSILAAWFSFQVIEKPFLALGRRFMRGRARVIA